MTMGWGRRTVALLAAGFVGGGVLAVAFVVSSAVAAGGLEDGGLFLAYLAMAPVWVIVFVPIYLVGLAILGLPAWLILENAGVRSRVAAVLIGAALSTALAVVLLLATGLDAVDSLAGTAVLFALSGAAAGWTLHRVAYGPNP